MKPYETQPGTVPHKVLAYLQRHMMSGAELSTAELADAVDADRNALQSQLATAVRHGAITKSKRNGIAYWSLGDGKPRAPLHEQEPDEPLATATPDPALAKPATHWPVVVPRATSTPRRPTSDLFRVGLTLGGGLFLQTSDTVLELTAEQTELVRKVAASLEGVAA